MPAANRQYGSVDLLLKAIVAQIIATVPGATAATCYISLDPDSIPPEANVGDYIFVVVLDDGTFDQEAFAGGGTLQMSVTSGFTVRIYGQAISLSDELNRATTLLTDVSLGLIAAWIQVVTALGMYDPQDANQIIMTREPIRPLRFRILPGGARMGCIETDFALNWDQYPGLPVAGAIP